MSESARPELLYGYTVRADGTRWDFVARLTGEVDVDGLTVYEVAETLPADSRRMWVEELPGFSTLRIAVAESSE